MAVPSGYCPTRRGCGLVVAASAMPVGLGARPAIGAQPLRIFCFARGPDAQLPGRDGGPMCDSRLGAGEHDVGYPSLCDALKWKFFLSILGA
eukprot:9432754-Pyramimonas_sp.AAC.1